MGQPYLQTPHGRFTNRTRLSPIAVAWATKSDYPHLNDPRTFSVTEIIQPSNITALMRRHRHEQVRDVVDMTSAAIGKAVHAAIAESLPDDVRALSEQQLTTTIDVDGALYTIRGQFDNWLPLWVLEEFHRLFDEGAFQQAGPLKIERPEGADDEIGKVSDTKTCPVWKVVYKDFDDWNAQVNLYAWLIERATGFKTMGAEIMCVLDGWKWRDAQKDPDYPQAKIVRVELPPIRRPEVIESWVKQRIREIRSQLELKDNQLAPCSPEERWEKPTVYAVTKRGNKRSMRNFEDRREAEAYRAKQAGTIDIIERPGERTRCEKYCSLRPWCSLYGSRANQNRRGNDKP